jgi:hypothetical protein
MGRFLAFCGFIQKPVRADEPLPDGRGTETQAAPAFDGGNRGTGPLRGSAAVWWNEKWAMGLVHA